MAAGKRTNMPQHKVLMERQMRNLLTGDVKSCDDLVSAVHLLVGKRDGYEFSKFSSTNNNLKSGTIMLFWCVIVDVL